MSGSASVAKYAPRIADFIKRRCALAAAAALAIALEGCGAAPGCARSSECEAGLVCGLDGRCGPLRAPASARFAASRWLTPTDWGTAGAGEPLGDALPVGGASEALLAFGPMPAPSRLARALLVLSPHARRPRLARDVELVAERVGAFRGGALPARHAVLPTDFAAAVRRLPEGPARRVRLDVTRAARDADGGALHLLVRVRGEGALTFASPWADEPASRPRLELMVR
ncbi:MAG: hypothetical protein KF729_11890 [Sandaracinaceae bacterium]|nr:hypothetical protein [Sandaracinaceae bacterium]